MALSSRYPITIIAVCGIHNDKSVLISEGRSPANEAQMTLVRSIWLHIDRFLAAILLTVAFAAVMPARGEAAVAVGWLTDAAIALLFFMHGAKLSPEVALL